MKQLDEVYVVTDGEKIFDADGHEYDLTIDTIRSVSFSVQTAKEVCENLNKYAYPGMLKVSKVELFAKIN